MSDNPRPHATRIGAIGAGIGGLTMAAVLARAGLHVTVLEGHVYAGGCAGTFYHHAFLSVSPTWDGARAPAGHRALTISTHTRLDPWWSLQDQDPAAFAARRQGYADRLLDAAERLLPGLRAAADLVLPGTPATFLRFTGRRWGWVGGFPQTSLFRTWAPQLGPGLYMVGDSIFPGQSTAAVALGGLRVANDVAHDLGVSLAPAPHRIERLDSEQKAYGRIPG